MKPEDVETWQRALVRFRERKDEFFRNDYESPVGHADQGAFPGLKYFEPDPAFRIDTELHRNPTPQSLLMTH